MSVSNSTEMYDLNEKGNLSTNTGIFKSVDKQVIESVTKEKSSNSTIIHSPSGHPIVYRSMVEFQ